MELSELESSEAVKRMLAELNLLTRSENTKLSYLKGLRAFFRFKGITNPDEFIESVKKQQNQNQLYKDFILFLASENKAPKTVAAWGASLKKFFAANGLPVTEKVQIKVYNVHEDELPKKEDLQKALKLADVKARTVLLLLASSGMRIGELHQLKLSDIDLTSDPPKITIKSSKAKERKSRITFITPEARKALEDYLQKRKIVGHTLTPDSPVIATDDGKPMSYQNLEFILENVFIKIAGKEGKRYKLHPHSLRKWFKTQLISAGVPAPIVDRLTGHARYLAREYELYTEDQLREWYKKGMSALLIEESSSA